MKNNYKNDLLNIAVALDATVSSHGKITECAVAIVERQDESATIELLKQIKDLSNLEKQQKEVIKLSIALKDSLIKYYGYVRVTEICRRTTENEDKRTLSDLMNELNELIGLDIVKMKVNDLIAYQKVQKIREQHGLLTAKKTLHLAFTGNPGTGKTTVARIVGRIYKQIGLLSKGHFIEVSRTDLIAGYQGQTALKVKSVIDNAKGGVLFIDEAYSITENDHSDSYGRECLTELTKALEDYRDDLVVIVAGYTVPMNNFFESNPGLKSRFNTFIEFDDYSAEELEDILILMCKKNDYILSGELKIKIKDALVNKTLEKDDNFANARLIRNIYDDITMNHAKRIVHITRPNYEMLSTLSTEDFI